MRLSCRVGEGGGHGDEVAGRGHEGAVELGEAQVVADAQVRVKLVRDLTTPTTPTTRLEEELVFPIWAASANRAHQ